MKIIHHHIIHYACGCTTTRIEVQLAADDRAPICAGHHLAATREEQVTEFHNADEGRTAGVEQALSSLFDITK